MVSYGSYGTEPYMHFNTLVVISDPRVVSLNNFLHASSPVFHELNYSDPIS